MALTGTLELIETLEQQVEKHLEQAIRVFQNLDQTALVKPSETGGWSIVQCLWHLNSYGDFYLPQIEKGLQKGKPQALFKSGFFGAYFTRMMQPSANGKRYKAFKTHTPPDIPDAHATVAEFIHQQEQLLGYLKKARHADLNVKLPISISTMVKLKLGDVLQFIITHDERHIQQAFRNLDIQKRAPVGRQRLLRNKLT